MPGLHDLAEMGRQRAHCHTISGLHAALLSPNTRHCSFRCCPVQHTQQCGTSVQPGCLGWCRRAPSSMWRMPTLHGLGVRWQWAVASSCHAEPVDHAVLLSLRHHATVTLLLPCTRHAAVRHACQATSPRDLGCRAPSSSFGNRGGASTAWSWGSRRAACFHAAILGSCRPCSAAVPVIPGSRHPVCCPAQQMQQHGRPVKLARPVWGCRAPSCSWAAWWAPVLHGVTETEACFNSMLLRSFHGQCCAAVFLSLGSTYV